jgi:Na+-translocating ferredoxin:NAD+ oxidoreductase RnfD subunit
MSSEPVSLPGERREAGAEAVRPTTSPPHDLTTSQPAAAAKPKPKFDQRYVAPLFITLVILTAHFGFGVLVSPWKTLTAIGTAVLVEVVLGRIFYGKVPHLASAYITGISIGILLRSEAAFWPYAFCSAISIISKYVIRWHGRHLWNPSNFGIGMTLIVAPWAVHTLGKEFSNSLWSMIVIWTLGSIIIARLKRFHICLTYVLAFVFFAVIRHWVTGHPLLTELGPITGPMYQLFIFFMITDPKTTVMTKRGQILVAFLVAFAEHVLRLNNNIHAPYYALFFVGPVANAIEIWWTERKKKLQPPLAPA